MSKDENTEDIQQVTGASPDFKTELAAKLQELVPEAIADGKVDTKKLQELLDGDSADESERFGLFWPGKKRAMSAAQEPTTATLKPNKEESKNWDTTENIFIEGDNLEVLKILQKHYHNKIKMIYIDPPYNTGKDFVYPDNYKEGLASYLEFTDQVNEEGKKVSTNSDTDGRYHSNWLNMMYPRLKLARNLLTNDGVIFISIGSEEISNIEKIMNEIYGENNRISIVTRIAKSASNKGTFFAPSVDYILCYSKNITELRPFADEVDTNLYRKTEKNGPRKGELYRDDVALYQSGLVGHRPNCRFYINTPWGEKVIPPIGKFWRWGEETLQKNLDLLVFKKTSQSPLLNEKGDQASCNIYVKSYLSDRQKEGTKPRDFTDEFINRKGADYMKRIDIPFEYAKPRELVRWLMKIIQCTENDIVCDIFTGSATTADAVMQLNAEDGGNRKHIQVQLPEPIEENSEAYKAGYKTIAEIAKERIRRAGEKIKVDYADKLQERETPLDIGFKVFKLADTNFSKWQTSSDVDVDKVQQRLLDMRESSDDNASQEDLLTEILLKLGISLTAKVDQEKVSGLQVYDVNSGAILAYLDEHTKPTLGQLRDITATEPAKFVILEDAFAGDDELKTNLTQICKTKDIELWTV